MLTEEGLLDAVDAWHQDPHDMSIHEFLGWTWEQYAYWVETNKQPGETVNDNSPLTEEPLRVMSICDND